MTPLDRAMARLSHRQLARFEAVPPNFALAMPDLGFCPPDQIHFAGWNLPLHTAELPYLLLGAQRSGKSVSAKLFGLTALQSVKWGLTKRAFFLDPKGEWKDLLDFYLPNATRYVQPFDLVRGSRWDLFADITTPDEALALGGMLAPTPPDINNQFFDNVARDVIGGLVLSALVTRGTSGTLKDVTCWTDSVELMKEGLELARELNRPRMSHFASKSPNRDVVSTIVTKCADLRSAADRWEEARSSFTLKGFAASHYALILGYAHNYPEAFAALARVILEYISRLTLSEPDIYRPKTWIFLDEMNFYGRLNFLPGLLALGPAKGLGALLTGQELGLFRATWGPDLTQALSGMSQQKAFFRLSDPDTADWASRHFGDMERVRVSHGMSLSEDSDGRPNITHNLGEQFERVRAVPPEVFLGHDLSDQGYRVLRPLAPPWINAINFYVSSPWLGNYADSVHLDTIRRYLPRRTETELPPAELRRLLPPTRNIDQDLEDEGGSASLVPVRPPTPPLTRAAEVPAIEDDDDELTFLH